VGFISRYVSFVLSFTLNGLGMIRMETEVPSAEQPVKPKRKRMRRSEEFLALCRRARGQKDPDAPKPEKEKRLSKVEQAMLLEAPPPPTEPKQRRRKHAMTRDRRTGHWKVRVPSPDGITRYVSTGEKEIDDAMRVVDRSGVEQLSVLARAKCLTQNAAAIIIAGHGKTCDEVKREWLADIRLSVAPATVGMYGMYVAMLFVLYKCGKQPVSFLTREMLNDFVNETGIKQRTREMRRNAISSFYRHASGFGHVTGNIASTVVINHRTMTVAEREEESEVPMTEEEYRKIVTGEKVPRFWRIATTLAYWLGLRMVDVCRLERASINEDFAVLYPQKTGRRLTLPITDPLIGSGELREVFRSLLEITPENQVLCFPAQSLLYDKQRSNLLRSYRKAMASVGVEGRTFHSLRHSFKKRLIDSGKSLEEVRDLMGHVSTHTTERYARVAPKEGIAPVESCQNTQAFIEERRTLARQLHELIGVPASYFPEQVPMTENSAPYIRQLIAALLIPPSTPPSPVAEAAPPSAVEPPAFGDSNTVPFQMA
jgi:integrase